MRSRMVGMFTLFVACMLAGALSAHDDPPKKQTDPPKKQTDEEIAKLLIGKWDVDEGDGQKEAKIKGWVKYKKEGKFDKEGKLDVEATVDLGKTSLKLTLSGTWKVADGFIIVTITKSDSPDSIKEGLVSKHKVDSIDEKQLKYKDEMDRAKVLQRAKE
jgi:hypothetical protein